MKETYPPLGSYKFIISVDFTNSSHFILVKLDIMHADQQLSFAILWALSAKTTLPGTCSRLLILIVTRKWINYQMLTSLSTPELSLLCG